MTILPTLARHPLVASGTDMRSPSLIKAPTSAPPLPLTRLTAVIKQSSVWAERQRPRHTPPIVTGTDACPSAKTVPALILTQQLSLSQNI
ncbi:hypothetical protein J6590_043561 [Homalodisca vitripennis]|nr:hypothetical protein J6590_043561 [Homalodisca vitripennis]